MQPPPESVFSKILRCTIANPVCGQKDQCHCGETAWKTWSWTRLHQSVHSPTLETMSWTELNTQRILGKPYESLRKIDLAINSEETRGRSTTKIIVNICIAMSLPQTEGHIFAWPGTVEIWVTEWNTRQNSNKNVIGHGEKHHSSKQESHEKACDRNAVFETTKIYKNHLWTWTLWILWLLLACV